MVKALDKHRRTFFWPGGSTKKKYRLVKWEVICKSKRKGGLGVKDIRKTNISLLCKWWWKLETEDGIWQQLIKAKYIKNDSICTVKHKTDSLVWRDFLKIRTIYLKGRKINTKNWKQTLFWKDLWLGDKPISLHSPTLFDMCEDKNITVHGFLLKMAI
jgi:hypothetical protein